MEIDLCTDEIWDLLKKGSTNQRNFINSLRYSEFKEFIELWEEEYNYLDLRGCLNGGCLSVEEDGEIDEYTIWENGRVTIYFY